MAAGSNHPRPSIAEQADAVERAAANLRGHAENLERLVHLRRRPQHDLDQVMQFLPGLEAAVETMRFVQKHADKVRALNEDAA